LDKMRLLLATPPKPKLEGEDKSQHDGEWKTYNHRLGELRRYRGLTYNLLFGQCTQPLKDKMKNDPIYDEVTKSGNPLKLKVLIDMIVMAQTEHQYYCKIIHEQEKGLLGFVQGNMTNNAQYYEKVSKRISIDKAVGITRIHKVAVQVTAKKLFTKKVEDLKEEELHQAEEMAEESYIAYLMIMNSTAQHDKLKVSLTDDYAKGQDTYPKCQQIALRLLHAFTKTATPRVIVSEGSSFAVRNTGKTRSATIVERRATQPGSVQIKTKIRRRRRTRVKARMMTQTTNPRPANAATGVLDPSPARRAKAVPLRRTEPN
jgi:hypothetical protein